MKGRGGGASIHFILPPTHRRSYSSVLAVRIRWGFRYAGLDVEAAVKRNATWDFCGWMDKSNHAGWMLWAPLAVRPCCAVLCFVVFCCVLL